MSRMANGEQQDGHQTTESSHSNLRRSIGNGSHMLDRLYTTYTDPTVNLTKLDLDPPNVQKKEFIVDILR